MLALLLALFGSVFPGALIDAEKVKVPELVGFARMPTLLVSRFVRLLKLRVTVLLVTVYDWLAGDTLMKETPAGRTQGTDTLDMVYGPRLLTVTVKGIQSFTNVSSGEGYKRTARSEF
jgi:hypothetical protein